MHVGKHYPYLHDLWACNTCQWPNWVPRKVWWFFDALQPPEWVSIGPHGGASDEGVVSVDRKSVSYNTGPFGPWVASRIVIGNLGGNSPPAHITVVMQLIAIVPFPNQSLVRTLNWGDPVRSGFWDHAQIIPPIYSGVAPNGIFRPADWAEV